MLITGMTKLTAIQYLSKKVTFKRRNRNAFFPMEKRKTISAAN